MYWYRYQHNWDFTSILERLTTSKSMLHCILQEGHQQNWKQCSQLIIMADFYLVRTSPYNYIHYHVHSLTITRYKQLPAFKTNTTNLDTPSTKLRRQRPRCCCHSGSCLCQVTCSERKKYTLQKLFNKLS